MEKGVSKTGAEAGNGEQSDYLSSEVLSFAYLQHGIDGIEHPKKQMLNSLHPAKFDAN